MPGARFGNVGSTSATIAIICRRVIPNDIVEHTTLDRDRDDNVPDLDRVIDVDFGRDLDGDRDLDFDRVRDLDLDEETTTKDMV